MNSIKDDGIRRRTQDAGLWTLGSNGTTPWFGTILTRYHASIDGIAPRYLVLGAGRWVLGTGRIILALMKSLRDTFLWSNLYLE